MPAAHIQIRLAKNLEANPTAGSFDGYISAEGKEIAGVLMEGKTIHGRPMARVCGGGLGRPYLEHKLAFGSRAHSRQQKDSPPQRFDANVEAVTQGMRATARAGFSGAWVLSAWFAKGIRGAVSTGRIQNLPAWVPVN